MKTRHSDLWLKKRSSLGLKESQLEEELESVSGNFEKKARNIMIIAVVAGVSIFAISKIVGGSRGEKIQKGEKVKFVNQEKSAQKVVQKPSINFKNILLEKIIVAVVGFIIAQLGRAVAPTKEEDND